MGKSNVVSWEGLADFREQARPGEGCCWTPAADVLESDDSVIIELELPGLTLENVAVELLGKELRVFGKSPQATAKVAARHHVMERPRGRFSRTISLGFPINEQAISATLKNGLLTITVTKGAPARQSIPVE